MSRSLKQIQKLLATEARRNPEQNPKVSVNQRIQDHLDQASTLEGTSVPNSFVSFTKVDKLGINPGSTFNTPLGIYSYPSFYVMELVGLNDSMSNLPFAGATSEFANVFSAKGNVIDLSNVSSKELNTLKDNIKKMYLRYAGVRKNSPEAMEHTEFLEDEVFDAAPSNARIKTKGGQFWWITMEVASVMIEHPEIGSKMFDSWTPTKMPVSWNKVFREVGIDGCIDTQGDGIIHPEERVQAVFFSKQAIAESSRYFNRHSPADRGKGIGGR